MKLEESYLSVLRENLEASKRHQDKRVRELLVETYEDLIAIWEAKFTGKIRDACKKEAIEFGEWLRKNRWQFDEETKGWMRPTPRGKWHSFQDSTTEKLYQQYDTRTI